MFPKFPDIPPNLQRLYSSRTGNAKHFQTAIRFFNAGMARASLQVNDSTVHTRGPAAFKVYGQMHRRIGSMLAPSNATQYSCLQVYFCDPADQDRYHASRDTSSKTDREKEKNMRVFAALRRILTQEVTNTYLQSFST